MYKMPTHWSASSLSLALSCEWKWHARKQLHLQPDDAPPWASPLEFGTAFHECCEHYAHCRALGLDHDEALAWTLRKAWLAVEANLEAFLVESQRSIDTLMGALVYVLDRDDAEGFTNFVPLPNGEPAIEVHFEFDTGLGFNLHGYFDAIVELDDGLWIVDRKTTKREVSDWYWDKFRLDTQVSVYALAGQVVMGRPVNGVIIGALQVLATLPPRYVRQPFRRTEAWLEDWLKDVHMRLTALEAYNRAGRFPRNHASCHTCIFKSVCARDPSVRRRFMEEIPNG